MSPNQPFPKQADVEAAVDRLWTQLRFVADGAAIDNRDQPQRVIVERVVKAALVCALDNRLIEVTEEWPHWIRLEPSWQAEDPAIAERLVAEHLEARQAERENLGGI